MTTTTVTTVTEKPTTSTTKTTAALTTTIGVGPLAAVIDCGSLFGDRGYSPKSNVYTAPRGTVVSGALLAPGSPNPAVFLTQRWARKAQGPVEYVVAVRAPGQYALYLYFAETCGCAQAITRQFDVVVQGTIVAEAFSPLESGGGQQYQAVTIGPLLVTTDAVTIRVRLDRRVGNPFISGIYARHVPPGFAPTKTVLGSTTKSTSTTESASTTRHTTTSTARFSTITTTRIAMTATHASTKGGDGSSSTEAVVIPTAQKRTPTTATSTPRTATTIGQRTTTLQPSSSAADPDAKPVPRFTEVFRVAPGEKGHRFSTAFDDAYPPRILVKSYRAWQYSLDEASRDCVALCAAYDSCSGLFIHVTADGAGFRCMLLADLGTRAGTAIVSRSLLRLPPGHATGRHAFAGYGIAAAYGSYEQFADLTAAGGALFTLAVDQRQFSYAYVRQQCAQRCSTTAGCQRFAVYHQSGSTVCAGLQGRGTGMVAGKLLGESFVVALL